MYVVFPIIVCLCISAFAKSVEHFSIEDADRLFEDFIQKFGKKYAHETEKEKRFQIFKKNLEIVNRMNKEQTDAVFGKHLHYSKFQVHIYYQL